MATIAFGGIDSKPEITTEGCTVRVVTYERTATDRKICVEFDTRTEPEVPDIILPAEGTWTVVDQDPVNMVKQPGFQTPVVARFKTLAEAEAAIVGLEYLDPNGVKNGRFGIDSPAED